MEFSFDRSRQSNNLSQNNQSQATASAQPAAHSDEVDPSTITNERLRKAIERNRERQKQRDEQSRRVAPQASSTSSQDVNSAWAQHQAHMQASNPRAQMEEHVQSPLFQERAEARQETRQEPRQEARPETRPETRYEQQVAEEQQRYTPPPQQPSHAQADTMANHSDENQRRRPLGRAHIRREGARFESTANATPAQEEVKAAPVTETAVMPSRRTVAKPDDTEFTPVKRTTKKAASHISYTTGTKKKAKEVDPKLIDYLVKGSWLFCGFLVLRLIFANGGVVDYFSQRSILNQRFAELTRIKKENMSLVHEIERMQLDAAYQKRLVRDNLGFIAQDEFLILFPKD